MLISYLQPTFLHLSRLSNFFPKLHGLPKNIISDRDPNIYQQILAELFEVDGVHLRPSLAYHPWTNDQTKVTNKILEGYLRCFASDNPRERSNWLTMSKWWHNSRYHTSTKSTPLEPVYGYPTQFYQLQTMKQWIRISEKDHKYYKQSKAEINLKLTCRYFRPFKIKARVRDVACCLQMRAGTRVRPTFHISPLTKK